MNRNQHTMATVIRLNYDAAHAMALTSDGMSDRVFVVQDIALGLADRYAETDPGFDRQAFLALAIDQPGIGAERDKP